MIIDTKLLVGPWDCTIDEYHADHQWLSHSALEIFRKSPRLYKMWLDGGWTRELTSALRIGSALHVMVLEPETFEHRFDVVDCLSRNSKKYKEAVEFDPEHEHLLRSEFELVMKMASSIKCHSWIDKMISGAVKETSYRFVDPNSGIPCKMRLDGISGMSCSLVFELKTSRDPDSGSWVRDAANFGYHRQAAFYLKGLKSEIKPIDFPATFFHLVVGSVEPHDVFAYRLDQEALDLGKHENEQSLQELKERRKNNDWRERNHGKIATVSLPAWYLKKGWEE